jgi:hypothetical protein
MYILVGWLRRGRVFLAGWIASGGSGGGLGSFWGAFPPKISRVGRTTDKTLSEHTRIWDFFLNKRKLGIVPLGMMCEHDKSTRQGCSSLAAGLDKMLLYINVHNCHE